MLENKFVNMIKEELIQKETKLIEEEKKRVALEKTLRELKLKTLQYQINPHFIFNALNTIQNLAYIEQAPKTLDIIQFSDLIRYSLRNENEGITYLYDEINYAESYMNIQKVRFGEKINYSIAIDKKYHDLKCPFMIQQPVLDNFIKYVVEKNIKTSELRIKGYEDSNNFIIEVIDNGDGISAENIKRIIEDIDYKNKDKSTSLYNINQRLISLYGQEYKLEMYSANFKTTGLIINIKIPMVEVENNV